MANSKITALGAVNLGAISGNELFDIVQYDSGSSLWINRKVTLAQLVTLCGGGSSGWALTGNSGTNPYSDFIGTTDALPVSYTHLTLPTKRIV